MPVKVSGCFALHCIASIPSQLNSFAHLLLHNGERAAHSAHLLVWVLALFTHCNESTQTKPLYFDKMMQKKRTQAKKQYILYDKLYSAVGAQWQSD